MQIIGVAEKKGEYKGINYHNMMIYCGCTPEKGYGIATEKPLKIKMSKHSEILGFECKNGKEWEMLIGREITPLFDKFKNCNFIRFIDTDSN